MISNGNTVQMLLANPKHMNSVGQMNQAVDAGSRKFSDLITDALDRVSDSQLGASKLFEKVMTKPDEVEIHEVTTAMAQAEMHIRLVKAVVDRSIKAYNDITAMR